MDLTFSTEERAFEKEVRDFMSASLTPEMKRVENGPELWAMISPCPEEF